MDLSNVRKLDRGFPDPIAVDRRSALLAGVAFFLTLALAAAPARPGLGEWTTGGPYVSDVRGVAIHPWNPEIVYLGTPEGVLRTVDGGASWSDAGGLDGFFGALTIDPVDPSNVYATQWRTVLKSTDGGDSWTAIQTDVYPQFHTLGRVVIDPGDPSTLYVADAGGEGCPGCYEGALWKSTDGGESWADVAPDLLDPYFSALAIDPETPSTLYLGVKDRVFKSLDAGATWTGVTLPGFPDGERVEELVVDPRDPDVVYACAWLALYKSFDGGATWWRSPEAPRWLWSLTIDPSDSSRLYAATYDGIHRSVDGGTSWERLRHQAGSAHVRTVVIDPFDAATVYAATRGDGLVRSRDRGDSWSVVDVGQRFPAEVLTVAAAPTAPAVLYAGTRFGGVFRSVDGGRSWETRNRRLTRGPVQALAVAPSNPEIVLAGTFEKVFRSNDGGGSWTASRSPETLDAGQLAVDPRDPSRAYAGTPEGVYRSLDGGDSWIRVDEGMCSVDCPGVAGLAIHPRFPNTLYAATSIGLFKSTTGGEVWRRRFVGAVPAVAIDPSTPRNVYLTDRSSIFRSVDGGESWVPVNDGLCDPDCPRIGWIGIHPPTLYAGGSTSLYKSVDAGGSWSRVDLQGLNSISELAVHPWASSTLYLANLYGVYDLSQVDCTAPDVVCLNGGRFLVEVGWRDFVGRRGAAQLSPAFSGDSAVFWYFQPENWEMLVKVLDGTGFDDHFWVFAATASNVEYVLRVTDTLAGRARSYHNPSGQTAAALTETGSFPVVPDPTPPGPVVEEVVELSPTQAPERSRGFDPDAVGTACTATDRNLCLEHDRFRAEVTWRDFEGRTGTGRVVPHGTDDSGLLWFFHRDNWEMLVKVLDGCGHNGRHWVFAGATTNVEYTLTVTDTVTGEVVSYHNSLGSSSATITDTEALGGC